MMTISNVFTKSIPSGKVNQDRVAVASHNSRLIVIVADGAGGFGDGALIAQHIVDAAIKEFLQDLLNTPEECALFLRQLDQVLTINGELGESTAVVLVVGEHSIFGASVGDSGAILIQNNQSSVTLTENQNRKPLLGTGNAIPVAFGSFPGKGTILMASDGLFKYASMKQIVSILCSEISEDTTTLMVNLARLQNGKLPDDTTVAVLRVS